MLDEADKLRARFALNDPVAFKYRRGTLEGTITRTNPKRAVVLVEKTEYTVPYELLLERDPSARQREECIEAILQLARDLMSRYGLDGWSFRFDHSTRRAGCCSYRDKRISISFELARNGSEVDICDTILHEIAHALVGKKHNHDKVWKKKALEVGCSGERTHRLVFSPPRYYVTCENRCWKQTAERRNLRLICRTCGGKIVYSPYSANASFER